jgi:ubiquinone biosynthesis protein
MFWSRSVKEIPRGKRLYLLCCSLGPFFIKLGQLVSIRHDLFPTDVTQSLTKLQDCVPPEPFSYIEDAISTELNRPIHSIFRHIDKKPLGSASIAQVHGGILNNGEHVAIKILRPNIQKKIKLDMAILNTLCRLVMNHKLAHKLIKEYQYTFEQELNLQQEGSHYSQIKHHFKQDTRLYVPKVYWELTSQNMLTTERINAVNIRDIHQYTDVAYEKLAHHGLEIFFTQVFEHRFFHADMHPGNVLIDITNPKFPKYIAIDFGIIGIISEQDQYYLIESFLAIYHRDYARIAKLHIEADWVDSTTDPLKFENALRGVCEPIFSLPIAKVSIANIMQQIMHASKSFKLKMQPQLLMLQKTLFHVEALGRQLYPELNVLTASKPYIESVIKKRTSACYSWQHLQAELPRIIQKSPLLPTLMIDHLTKPNQKTSVPKQDHSTILYILIISTLINAPLKLTKPGLIYIITNIIIITVAWKKLRPKDSISY